MSASWVQSRFTEQEEFLHAVAHGHIRWGAGQLLWLTSRADGQLGTLGEVRDLRRDEQGSSQGARARPRSLTGVIPMCLRLRIAVAVLPVVACLLLTETPFVAHAQDALTAKVLPQGEVSVKIGEWLLGTLSLNAHGPGWQYVDQAKSTATVTAVGDEVGVVIKKGTLPVPNTDGGAIRFVETLRPIEKGFRADYVLGATQALSLNGLHVSLLMPMATFTGETVKVHPVPVKAEGGEAAPAAPAREITVPEQLDQQGWQLYVGPAGKIEISPGTDCAVTVTATVFEPTAQGVAAPPVFAVQDLRRWNQDTLEVRISLINSDTGQLLSAEGKLRVALEVRFAGELQWQ